jgi:putative MATE family efflux protein
MKSQSERLGKEPIPRLLAKLSIPAMLGMFVMALYNIVDTIFIARWVGTLGIAGVSIAFPVQLIIMAVAGAVGIGGASVISRRLGANKLDDANHVFGNVIVIVIGVSAIGVIIGMIWLDPILYLFGSTDEILPYARDYLSIILFGTIFFAFAFSMNNIVRAEGNAKIAMYTMLISAILNIILDPIFIFVLEMGVRGAALATVISQATTAIYLVFYFFSGKSSLTLYVANLKPNLPLIKEIFAIGSSAFARQVSGSLMFIVINHSLVFYGGTLGVAVFGIIHKIIMFSLMPMFGIVQGLQPIVGYNYGAKQNERVSQSILLAFKVATMIAIVAFIVMMAVPKQILHIFSNDQNVIDMGSNALRITFCLAFTIGIQMITGGVFQALGKARTALVLSMSRQIIFLIPLVLILPHFFDLLGVWLAFPIADLLSFALALWYIKRNKSIFQIGQRKANDKVSYN